MITVVIFRCGVDCVNNVSLNDQGVDGHTLIRVSYAGWSTWFLLSTLVANRSDLFVKFLYNALCFVLICDFLLR